MLVNVRSINGGKPVTLAIHNSGWRRMSNGTYQRAKMPTKPEVPPSLSRVLGQHKVGDVLAIRAQTIGNVLVLHSAKAHEAKPGEFAADSAVFVKSEDKSTSSGRTTTYVTLVKNGQTSVMRLMQTRTKDDKGRTTYVTRPDLVEALAAINQGDLVEVDVGKIHGKKVIRHIARWQEPKTGHFVALGQAEVDKTKHVTVQIRPALGDILTAMIQQNCYDGVRYTDDYTMARFVRKLKADQAVTYKTRTHGEKTIIWQIARAVETSVATTGGKEGYRTR